MDAARPFLIGDEWRRTDLTEFITNPSNGQVLAAICLARETEANQAIESSVTAFRAMRQLPSHVRAKALLAIAASLTEQQEVFAQCITAESGKPISDARREVSRAIQTFTIASEEAKRISGEVIPLDITPGTDGFLGISRRFPIGPVLGITPFNFPLNLVAHKLAPCLAAGNPMVLKPAPQTPLTALMLGEVVSKVDLPPGAFNIVPCHNAVAEGMVTDPRFALLSFTGSASVGWMLKTKAGKKRVVLELGGNAAVLVEPDADLELTAQRCAAGGYGYAGQTCISVQRIFVQESVYDRFLKTFLAKVQDMKLGDPLDTQTVVGPLIDQRAASRVEAWIGEAVGQGGRLVQGGTRKGAFVDASVLIDVTSSMKVCSQEVFGPLVTVTPYRQLDEAIAEVNASSYGLQAGIFTTNVHSVFRAFRDLEVGAVLANEIPTFRSDHMPYGGIKDSGLGREGVRYAIDEMTEMKLLVLNLMNQDGD